MAKIDIRAECSETNAIVFADKTGNNNSRFSIELQRCSPRADYVAICAEDRAYVSVRYSDIPNLIKALEKAVELGWDK